MATDGRQHPSAACTAFIADLNGTPVSVREGQRERADSALVAVSQSLWVDGSGDEGEIATLGGAAAGRSCGLRSEHSTGVSGRAERAEHVEDHRDGR